jgi:hypothetical protein
MTATQQFSPIVPREFAGLWIAWNKDHTKIVASGPSLEEARQAASAAGEESPIFAKAPHADVRFLGGVR